MSKNRSLFSGVAERLEQREAGAGDTVAAGGPFAANLAAITNPRAPGQPDAAIRKPVIERHLWVDPALCRPWAHHNRAYELLDEERCADLIAGFRTVGHQQRPAIVRTLRGEARLGPDGHAHEFEIISGVRRHWTVSWLRARDEVNAAGEPFLFLAVVRDDLDTVAAFELSDAENRGQQDISDYERAREYHWALAHLYEGNVSRMAGAIQMDRSHLTRILALNAMPGAVVAAYPSILEIRVHHWRQLAPFFADDTPEHRAAALRILALASAIAAARASGQLAPDTGAQTLARLLAAAKETQRSSDRPQVLSTISAQATGKPALRVKRSAQGLMLEVPRASGATRNELYDALRLAVDTYYEPA